MNLFANPWVLVLIPLLLLAARPFFKRDRLPRLLFPVSIPKEARARNPQPLLFALRLAAVALVIIALARPQDRFKQTERKVSGVDIVMVMDVSASMLAEDLADTSRLEVAKRTILKFIEGRENDRIGFVVFSGEPLTLAPLTLDYGILRRAVSAVETGTLKDGTGIGDGLSLAIARLRESEAKSRVIVLLTDGDNNVGQVDPATAGDLAAGYGIRVYTIAIGKEGPVRIPIKRRNPWGGESTTYQTMQSAINPELLMQIAKQTNARFYRVTEADALERVYGEIDRLEKSKVESRERTRFEERFEFPLLIALALLAAELLIALSLRRAFA